MPLPVDPKQHWPPEHLRPIFSCYEEHSAWFAGDPLMLGSVYGQRLYGLDVAEFFTKPIGSSPKFWSSNVQNERRTMLHVPVPGDISQTSANMLFSEHPKINVAEARGGPETSDAVATQKWLEDMLEQSMFYSRILEAAETASALGGVFMKVDWNRDISPYPIFSVVQADQAVPEFKFGYLSAVTFWTDVEKDEKFIWRHLERHEVDENGKGIILNGLYKVKAGLAENQLGESVPLSSHAATADLEPLVETGVDGLCCVYVPNKRPNRKFRKTYFGQSDYAGNEGVFDSIDEAYSSLMRDIRLGKGRLTVPQSFLMFDAEGKEKPKFIMDKEVYVGVNTPVNAAAGFKDQIVASQFEIRAEQHLSTIENLMIRAFTSGGYAPQSFGLLIQGSAESGTALRMRERKSFITTQKKAEYWRPALSRLIRVAIQIANNHLDAGIQPYAPQVAIQDSVPSDLSDVAESVQMLRSADAMSIETAVRAANPDWDDKAVLAEVARIKEDNAPPPVDVEPEGLGFFGGFGGGEADLSQE